MLSTMLKGRKIELHRRIAEALEKDQGIILEQSDIARLLTLFDHWKESNMFCKAAPLALAVGTRLNEWDLSTQSLELYKDALEMAFGIIEQIEDLHERRARKLSVDIECSDVSVHCMASPSHSESAAYTDEWAKVSAEPEVLDLIVRLHIRIAEAYRLIGDLALCIETFQDAYAVSFNCCHTSDHLSLAVLTLPNWKLGLDPEFCIW